MLRYAGVSISFESTDEKMSATGRICAAAGFDPQKMDSISIANNACSE